MSRATKTAPRGGESSASSAIASVLADLEVAIDGAEARGDHHAHAVLNGLAVGAGALKHKADEAVTVLEGADASLAGRVAALF